MAILKGRCNEVGATATINEEPSKVQQHKKDKSDINLLVKRYAKTGLMPTVDGKPIYADISALGDYHEMLNRGLSAKRAFQALPADFRKRVQNDPKKAIEFIEDPNNTLEAVALGVLPKEVIPKLVVDPLDTTKLTYVDKNGEKTSALPGMKDLETINAERAERNKAK